MLDEKDLEAIDQRIEKTIAEKVPQIVREETARELNLVAENVLMPQLNLLAEGQKALLDKLAPKSRVEELEEEVAFLKSVVRANTRDIAELKKAQ